MDIRLIFRSYFYTTKTDAGTRTVSPGEEWFRTRMNGDLGSEVHQVGRQEKPLRGVGVSVPQTDTGGRDEYSQALG